MRRLTALIGALTVVLAIFGAIPASATHNCTTPSCNPVTVAILEGKGLVCDQAQGFTSPKCTYHNDALWPGSTTATQGLYWPGVGPPGNGPFSFNAGPSTDPPNSLCVSSVGSSPLGCSFVSKGQLYPGASGFGAYCGSSKGVGTSTYKSGDGTLTVVANFGWEQSAATILPLTGEVTSTSPAGGAGATVVGFTSSRGLSGAGNCGITQATTGFQVEGMIVTF